MNMVDIADTMDNNKKDSNNENDEAGEIDKAGKIEKDGERVENINNY